MAKELGIAPLTLCTTVGQRDVVIKNSQYFSVNVKQAKTPTHVKQEEVLMTWFREAVGINVDGKVLCEKADYTALSLAYYTWMLQCRHGLGILHASKRQQRSCNQR